MALCHWTHIAHTQLQCFKYTVIVPFYRRRAEVCGIHFPLSQAVYGGWDSTPGILMDSHRDCGPPNLSNNTHPPLHVCSVDVNRVKGRTTGPHWDRFPPSQCLSERLDKAARLPSQGGPLWGWTESQGLSFRPPPPGFFEGLDSSFFLCFWGL